MGDSDLVTVGQAVYAIGSPKGFELTLSEGIVSGLREIGDGFHVVQTSAAISAGSSGGGLFDSAGRLIGVTSFKIRDGENLNFALPANYIQGMTSSTLSITLEELARRSTNGPQAATAAIGDRQSIPRLAAAYSNGPALAVVEQDGPNVRLSFTNTGYVFASATLVWNPTAKAFVGDGTLDTECGNSYKRFWKAPVHVEIYYVNPSAIRERVTIPTKVNCGRERVVSYETQELIWVSR